MADGKTVEVAVVGSEGVAGVPSIFGLLRSPIREVVQIAGDGFRIKVSTFRRILRSSPLLQALLGRFSVVLAMQISQTAACNRLHDIERRLARWLLLAQDRVDAARINMTHDFLATMLGTDRPSVSVAAANLQRKEVIDYTRGSVQIVESEGTAEKCACRNAIRIIQQFNGEIDSEIQGNPA